jgi:hypothetical protein
VGWELQLGGFFQVRFGFFLPSETAADARELLTNCGIVGEANDAK